MAQMKITEKQANELLKARDMDRYARKNAKRRIFSEIRRQHSLPPGRKIKLFIENPDNPLYLVIRDKRTGMPLDDGKPTAKPETKKPLVSLVPKAKKPAAKKATPAKKTAAKKPATKAVAKKAAAKKPATKAVAKKPATKAVAKKVAAKKPATKKATPKK